MKKIISIISALALGLTLAGCDKTTVSDDPFAGLELSNAWDKSEVDRIYYTTLEELEKKCDIAVVATVVGEPIQEIFYDNSMGKNVMTNAITTNTIEVSRVIRGDICVGDNIDVYQRYCIFNDETLLILDGNTPLIKGDEWLLFLQKQPGCDLYFFCGVIDGRYPTPNTPNNAPFSLSDYSELGVFDEKDFNKRIYKEILEKYDFMASDEILEKYDFVDSWVNGMSS